MKLLLISLFILPFSVFSQHDHSTHSDPTCAPIEEKFFYFKSVLDWFGANDKDIEKAPCKTKSSPSEEEIVAFIEAKSAGPTQSETVHGVRFENEDPLLIKAFRDFTTAKDAFGFKNDKSNQKDIQKEFQVNPECQKVMCAMEKIWGKDLAYKMMYIRLKHNFNTSEMAFHNSDRFTPDELNDVLIGLEDVPSHLIPLGKDGQRLTHFKRGYTPAQFEDGKTVANAIVMLFDPWNRKGSWGRQYTIFHEMAHNISTRMEDMDESPQWLGLSQWVKKGDEWQAEKEACFVSRYGKANPWEDYAESLSAYRYNAKSFKKKCPEKYSFLKDAVFKGIEYTDVGSCSPVPLEKFKNAQNELSEKIIQAIGTRQISIEELNRDCAQNFSSYPVKKNELAACSVKLHFRKDDLTSVLKNNNIPDTALNRDTLLGLFSLKDDDVEKIFEKSTIVTEQVENAITASIIASLPQTLSSELDRNNYRWRWLLDKCGHHYLEKEPSKVMPCQLQKVIDEDRELQSFERGILPRFSPPPLFQKQAIKDLRPKRDQQLISHLLEKEEVMAVIQKQSENFKKDLEYHRLVTSQSLRQKKDWKKETPENFCRQNYALGSSWTSKYGAKEGEIHRALLQACISVQTKKKKRFEIKDSEWLEKVEQLLLK